MMNEMTQLDRIRLFCEVLEETDIEQVRGLYGINGGGFCAFGVLGETLVRRCVHGWSEDRHNEHNAEEVLDWINEGQRAPNHRCWLGRVKMNNAIGRRLIGRMMDEEDFCDEEVKEFPEEMSVVSLNDELYASFTEIAALIRLEFNLPKVAPPLLALMDEPEDEPQDEPLPQPMRPLQVKPQRELEPA